MEKKVGVTIGKFAPFHKGHELLIKTALNEMDKVIVVVYDTNVIDISSEDRAKWIKELYPNVEIRFAHNPPSQYGLDDESVNLQMEYLTKIIGNEKVTHFYSSEKYGTCAAKYLNAIDRQVDPKKEIVPISATKIRLNFEKEKRYLEKNVYEDIKDTFDHSLGRLKKI